MTKFFFLSMLTFMTTTKAIGQIAPQPTYNGVSTLKLVHPEESTFKNPVTVQWNLDGKNLIVHFDVDAPVVHQKKTFGPKDYPFQFDVVEIFVAVNDPKEKDFSYFEFELTPNKQTYDVRIDFINGKKQPAVEIQKNVEVGVSVSPKNWSGSFIIPLNELGWKGNPQFLRGNFYAIIGKAPRTYWSSFLPPQQKANFHKPEHFKPLFK